jgi:hypothetical protein
LTRRLFGNYWTIELREPGKPPESATRILPLSICICCVSKLTESELELLLRIREYEDERRAVWGRSGNLLQQSFTPQR